MRAKDEGEKVDPWEERQREEMELRRATLALQERQVSVQERALENGTPLNHEVRQNVLGSYFELPQEQQDFRLREEAVRFAVELGGDIQTVLSNARSLFAWIKGGGEGGG